MQAQIAPAPSNGPENRAQPAAKFDLESIVRNIEVESQSTSDDLQMPMFLYLSDVSLGPDVTPELVNASTDAVTAASRVRQLAEAQLANEKVKLNEGRSQVRFVLEDQYTVAKALTTQVAAVRNLMDAKSRVGLISAGSIVRKALASGLAKPLPQQ